MKIALPCLAASVVVIASGIVQGFRTDRWTISQELSEAVARINNVPSNFGDWTGSSMALNQKELDAGGIIGHLSRRYKNRRDGRIIDVLLVCGRPGPISVHTPDICYAGNGYVLRGSPTRLPVTFGEPGQTAEAWRGDFVKQTAVATSGLRILWLWAHGERWIAPDNPRLTFARYRSLYKLYVIRETGGVIPDPGEVDPTNQFLADFIPVLDRALDSSSQVISNRSTGVDE